MVLKKKGSPFTHYDVKIKRANMPAFIVCDFSNAVESSSKIKDENISSSQAVFRSQILCYTDNDFGHLHHKTKRYRFESL